MVYKPEMDKRAQRPKEQAQQGKDITRIADGQEKSAKSIENLIGQQKIANENLETGFDALMKSQKTSFIRRNLDNLFEIVTTRKEGKNRRKQAETFQKEHLVDDKKHHIEFKTSDKKTDLDYEIQRHQEDTGKEQLTVLGKIAKIFGVNVAKATKATIQYRDAAGRFAEKTAAGVQQRYDKAVKVAEKEEQERQKIRAHNIGLRAFAKTRVMLADKAAEGIKKQQERLDEMKKSLDSVGKTATDSFRFRRVERKLIRREWMQAKASGSKDAEKKAKDRMREARSQTTLFRMAKGIGKMAGFMGKAAKTVAGKFPSFGKLLTMGIIGALFAFMNSPAMAKAEKFILETLIPKFGTWYDTKFEPMFAKFLKFIEETTIPGVWEGIEQSLTNMGPIFTDIENIVKELGEGGLLKAFEHTLSLVKNIMILFIDGVGNILKSLGLVDFKGPSATDAMKKGWAPTIEAIKKNLPWWFPTSMVFPEQADKEAKIRILKKSIAAMEEDKKSGMWDPLGSDPKTLKDFYEELRKLEGGKPVSTIVPEKVKSAATALAATAEMKRVGREAALAKAFERIPAGIFGGPQMVDNSVKSVNSTSNFAVSETSMKNISPIAGILENSR